MTGVWSNENPRLQTHWDSTSLRALLACPYRYYLAHVEGWQTVAQRVDLEFGRIAGDGLETFYRGIIEDGLDHDEALRRALRRVLTLSWDDVGQIPLLGTYEKVWRCTGATKYKNAKGNAAKCPFSHKGKFYLAPGPTYCSCGSLTETQEKWVPENPVKDRYQLIRLIVWYAEEVKNGYLKPISWKESDAHPHKALVEVPWVLPIYKHQGRMYYLCGWFDAVKSLGSVQNEAFITDYKTTKHTIGAAFFAPFAPDLQVSIYDLAGAKLLSGPLPYRGVAIEGIQVLQGGVRFGFMPFYKTDEQRAELVRELQIYLGMAIQYAQAGYWPMNRASCHLCQFKGVCAAEPGRRQAILEQNFTRSWWNPLKREKTNVGPSDRGGMGEGTLLADETGQPAGNVPVPWAA